MPKQTKLKAVKLGITKQKVLDLIDERAKDDDTALPVYPSAQYWFNMTTSEQNELIKAVEQSGLSWGDYEMTMKAHWPAENKNTQKHNVREI